MKIYYWVLSFSATCSVTDETYLFVSKWLPHRENVRALLIGSATVTCQIMSMLWPTRIRILQFVWDVGTLKPVKVAETSNADRRRCFISGRFFLGVCILTPGAAADAWLKAQLSESWPFCRSASALHWKQRAYSFSASCDITLPLAKCSQTPERIICFQK